MSANNLECEVCNKSYKKIEALNKHKKTEIHLVKSGELKFEGCLYCRREIKSSKVNAKHFNTPMHLKNVEKFNKINKELTAPLSPQKNGAT